jgi:hypothetical protein
VSTIMLLKAWLAHYRSQHGGRVPTKWLEEMTADGFALFVIERPDLKNVTPNPVKSEDSIKANKEAVQAITLSSAVRQVTGISLNTSLKERRTAKEWEKFSRNMIRLLIRSYWKVLLSSRSLHSFIRCSRPSAPRERPLPRSESTNRSKMETKCGTVSRITSSRKVPSNTWLLNVQTSC